MARPDVDKLIQRAAGSIFMTTDLVGAQGVGGGLLNPTQADTFIRMLTDQPTILNDIRTVKMPGPQMRINKIVMTDRLLHKPTGSITALSSGDYGAPDTSYVDLQTQELVAEVRIPYDVLEDNIEGSRFEQTVMELVTQKVSMELEELLLLGDTGGSFGSATSMFLAQDGVIKLADSYDVGYASPPAIDEYVFATAFETLPPKYQRNKNALKFYVPSRLEFDYNKYLGQRPTVMGDNRLTTVYDGALKIWGVQIVPCASMPDDTYIFCDPKNLIMGLQRRITVETDKNISERVIIIVLTLRVALQIEEKLGVVVVNGLYNLA